MRVISSLLCARVSCALGPMVLSLALHAGASAQVLSGFPIGASGYMESVSVSDPSAVGLEGIDLFTFLFAGRTEIGERLRLGVSGGYARGALTSPDGSEATLSGLTDTQVTLSIPFARDFVVLSLIGVLPTGKSEMSATEAEVANIVAADLLPFRISHWGAGGGIGANIGFARPLGSVGVALGLGYVLSREYDPLVDQNYAYRPGNALTLSGGLDTGVGRAGKLALQVGIQAFSDDQLSDDELRGGNLYRAGSRFEAVGTYAFPVGSGSGLAYAGFAHRQAGDIGPVGIDREVAGSPSQDLVLVGAGARLAVGSGFLTPDLAVRVFRRSDGVGQGSVSRLGLGYELALGQFTAIPAVRAKFGSLQLVADQSSSGMSGFDIGLTIRYSETGS